MVRQIAPLRLLAIGVALPFTLLCLAGFALSSDQHFWGISLNIWGVFLCAPVTSICLRYCHGRLEARAAALAHDERAAAEGSAT